MSTDQLPLPPIGSRWGDLSPAQCASVPVGTTLRLIRDGSYAVKGPGGWTMTGSRSPWPEAALSVHRVIASYPEGAVSLPDPSVEASALREENARLYALLRRVSVAWDMRFDSSAAGLASGAEHDAAHADIKAALAANGGTK